MRLWNLRNPRSANWKLENLKSWWYNWVWVPMPENWESWWGKFQWSLNAQEPKVWYTKVEDDVPAERQRERERERRENSPLLQLFALILLLFSLNRLNDALPHWKKWSLLSLLTQMLIFFENTTTNTSRNDILLNTWASLSPTRLTHKINHHT
jgi:hypothetical protein